MDDKNLLKAALLCSVIGIVALMFLSQGITIEEKEINGTGHSTEGETIKITGVVGSVADREKVMTITIIQPKAMSVVVFKDGNLTIATGTPVQVIGRMDEFNGKEQLIADEIKALNEK